MNVSVRIGAHAITWVALGPLALPAFAGPESTPLQARVEASPSDVLRWREELGFGVDHGSDGVAARVIATAEVLDTLERRGATVTRTPIADFPFDAYRLPEEGGSRLRELALEAGDRGGYAVLGFSVEGRPIEALWLGQPPESGAPAQRVLAAHHGDEWSSFEVALATAEALAAGDGVDPAITAALDTLTVWVVPYVNPDGVAAMTRWNANTVDLNRNYDYRWSDDEFLPGDAPFTEPETRAIRAFGQWVQPVLALSLHSGAANFGWVWNHTTEPADDADALEGQALRYLGHTTEPDFWVTNGAAWYVSHGDTNDWSYGRHGVWDSTLELTVEKTPPSEAIDAFVAAHLPAMVDFVTLLPDARGVVVDHLSGRPLDAEVQLLGPGGPAGNWFRTEPATGTFFRVTDAAVDAVEVRSPGYEPAVAALDGAPVRLRRLDLDPRPLLPIPAVATATLPVAFDGLVTLGQPGHADREVRATGGVVAVADLPGGAWTARRSDGVVHRNGLLVSDAVRARVDRTERTGGRIVVIGKGFEPGSRAWALLGVERARLALPVVSLASDRLELDATPLEPFSDARSDLWLLVAGEHLFVGDLTGSGPETWDPAADRLAATGVGCACGPESSPGAPWPALALLGLLRRRR